MPRWTLSSEERFSSKIRAGDNGCVEWVGMRYRNGYGRFSIGNKHIRAHRFSYEFCVGPIPEGCELHHICGNRACVRPDHLEPRTKAEHRSGHHKNDAVCRNGHERTPENTYTWHGFNMCRVCKREWMRHKYKPKAA